MGENVSDRNLLVGLLALQMDFIRQPDLIGAMQAWVLNKSRELEDILLEQGAINEDTRDFLSNLVVKHIEFHENDLQKSLASLNTAASVQAALTQLSDDDLEASLTRTIDSQQLPYPGTSQLPSDETQGGNSEEGSHPVPRSGETIPCGGRATSSSPQAIAKIYRCVQRHRLRT